MSALVLVVLVVLLVVMVVVLVLVLVVVLVLVLVPVVVVPFLVTRACCCYRRRQERCIGIAERATKQRARRLHAINIGIPWTGPGHP